MRSTVAEPFKRQEEDGRWLWRLIGDQRAGGEADIADLFARGQAGPAATFRSDADGREDSGDGADDIGDE